MSIQSIIKRVDYRLRQMEKELEAREKAKKYKRPANVVAAQKAIDAIKEMEEYDKRCREAQLHGLPMPLDTLSVEARAMMKDRMKERAAGATRLREIEGQFQNALRIADETREQIHRGSQYVNYSNITLKAGGSANNESRTGASSVTKYVNLEAKINPLVLQVPVCGVCQSCTTNSNILCEKRLAVREKLVREATDKKGGEPSKKKAKKRKAEPKPSTQSTKGNATTKSQTPPKKKKKTSTQQAATKDSKPKVHNGNRKMFVPEQVTLISCHIVMISPPLCSLVGPRNCSPYISLWNQRTQRFGPEVHRRSPNHIDTASSNEVFRVVHTPPPRMYPRFQGQENRSSVHVLFTAMLLQAPSRGRPPK